MLPPGYPWVYLKNFSPAVWPAIENIYTNVLFYYKEDSKMICHFIF